MSLLHVYKFILVFKWCNRCKCVSHKYAAIVSPITPETELGVIGVIGGVLNP